MEVTSTEIEQVLKSLAETPHRLATASSGLESARLQSKPDEKSWSANDILAHLRACADVWGNSIQAMLAQEAPTLRHVSPRTWIRKTDYLELTFSESFQAFADQRNQLLNTLKNLDFEAWSRGALIKERRHTVFSQARRMAHHENEHCEQIEALLK
jgi:uncharacterized damage-inducible protein DinB